MTIVGPYDIVDWHTMKMLKQSIKWCKATDRILYAKTIKKEQAILLDYFRRINSDQTGITSTDKNIAA